MKDPQHKGHVTAHKYQTPEDVRDGDEDKFALCYHKDRALALASESSDFTLVNISRAYLQFLQQYVQ